MLVPLVLRNIVLPYLRGAGASSNAATAGVAVVAVSARGRRRITTSATKAGAEATLLAERDDLRWEPFARATPVPPPRIGHVAAAERKPPNRRDVGVEVPAEKEARAVEDELGEEKAAGRPEGGDSLPQRQPQRPPPQTRHDSSPSVDLSRLNVSRRAVPLPVSLRKLLDAKLFRAAVFMLLESPEWMADKDLVHAVAERLESKGAGTLAHRLRRTLEMPLVTGPNGRIRLWSDPKPKTIAKGGTRHPAPPGADRVPLVPREAYPESTAQARRTHHWNLLLTQWLTVRHPVPYASPFPRQQPDEHTPAPARLRRLRDVLHTIDNLRETRGFVPDRVTANIVLKAYLSCLARGTRGEGRDAHPLPFRAGLRSKDLHEVFRLIAASIEDGVAKGHVVRVGEDGEGSEDAGAGKKRKSRAKGKDKGRGRGTAEAEATTKGAKAASRATSSPSAGAFDMLEKFDPRVSYESHVQPFTRMMARAFVRVGDHRGRVAIEKWGEVMRVRIHKLQGRVVVEDERKGKGVEEVTGGSGRA